MCFDKKRKKTGRIGIDFHVVDGRFQGSRSHVIELFSRVIELSPDLEFFLFLNSTDYLKTRAAAFRSRNVRLVRMPSMGPVRRLLWQLPRYVKRYSLDILHTQYILPIQLRCSGMVTIHDVLFETHPRYFEFLFRLRSRIMMRLSARRSDHVFTVSQYSMENICRLYGMAPKDVTVIPNGVDCRRFYPGDDGKEVLRRWGLSPGRYMLTVGRLEPRKNHSALLGAYASLALQDIPLVMVGQRDFGYAEMFRELERPELRSTVKVLEDVSDDELPILYRHARVFIFPSWAEGFGMPLLEAMASGVPVVSSNTTALAEVVGDAGVLVEPANVEAIANAIRMVLENEERELAMRLAGYARSAAFDWYASALRVRQRYLQCLGEKVESSAAGSLAFDKRG